MLHLIVVSWSTLRASQNQGGLLVTKCKCSQILTIQEKYPTTTTTARWLHFIPENGLSASGYHLCVHNETRTVSFLAIHKVPYTATKPCGGWLLSTTCTVTLYKMIYQTEYKTVMEQVTKCCDGYVQVGRYCALCECAALNLCVCRL